MKKRELEVVCSYGSGEESISEIILKSFLLYLRRELDRNHSLAAPSPSAHM